ncbi:MAG: hypothetical protein AB7V50_02625 [Vampirovibrionia bacterium]
MNINLSNNLTRVQPKVEIQKQPVFSGLMTQQTDTVSFGSKKDVKDKSKELAVVTSIAKGIVKPIGDIVEAVVNSPLATGLIVATTAAAIHFIPVLGTALAIGVCGFGAFQMGAGLVKGIKEAKAQKGQEEKDYSKANVQFSRIGEGLFDVALTANAAIRGVKQLQGTVSAISEATAAATQEGKTINFAQKLYAVLKQAQTRAQVMNAPKQVDTVFSKIAQEGKAEFELLKSSGKIKKTTKDLKEIIEKVIDPGKKAQLVKLLDDLSSVTSKSEQASKITSEITSLLNAEKISGTETTRILEIIDASREQPAVLAVLKSAMKTGTVDDAYKALNKVIGANRYTDDAVKVVAGAETATDKD